MILTDRDNIRVAETDEELLTFDVSDDTLERAAPIVGGQATVTRVYGTAVDCGCASAASPAPPSKKPTRTNSGPTSRRASSNIWKRNM
jgi:hypothetical protein